MSLSSNGIIRSIKTKRLLIRGFDASDPIKDWCSPSDRENWTFPYQPSRCNEYYASYAVFGCGYRAIVLSETSEVIGRIGLTPRNMFAPTEIELCYALSEEHRGKGYMTEAGKALLSHAEENLELSRVFSRIRPDNIASKRVAENVGLLFEKEVQWRDKTYHLYWKRWKSGAAEVLNP